MKKQKTTTLTSYSHCNKSADLQSARDASLALWLYDTADIEKTIFNADNTKMLYNMRYNFTDIKSFLPDAGEKK